MQDLSSIRAAFQQRFGASPRLFRAPGRVNLIGEHTDYNDGFVMPLAIAFVSIVAASPRNDRKLVVHSLNLQEEREFDLDAPPAPGKHWSDYVLGVAVMLQKAGCAIHGANLLVSGNVPIGAGLSSSAALEVATALALNAVSKLTLDRREIALVCQRAENEFVGARCGIMDQFVAANGRAMHALMLDCRSLDYELLRLPSAVDVVICNSMVKHSIAGGEYNQRRAECEQAVRTLRRFMPEIRALRDVTTEQLERYRDELDPVIYRRCRHVVTENSRVLAMAAALRAHELHDIGELMAASHCSLQQDYEVSCPELDALVEFASGVEGVIGSRMTGGGFGGCTVNLVRHEAVEQFRSEVARQYEERTGIAPEIYVTSAAAAAQEIA